MWSTQLIKNSISDPELTIKVEAAMAPYEEHDKMGPLYFYMLIMTIAGCSKSTLSHLCDSLYKKLKLSNFPYEDVTKHTNVFLKVYNFLATHHIDLSEAPERLMDQMLQCLVYQFDQKFLHLKNSNDPIIRDIKLIATTATAEMTLLKHQGKWLSKALKQQAMFMA
jgi:hypothetical protein